MQQSFGLERLQPLAVLSIDRTAPRGDLIEQFQLAVQEGAANFARHVGAADIRPSVLVDLAAKELLAIRAFVANDLGALDQLRIVDTQRAPLAANVVFRLVKAVTAQIADRTQSPVVVFGVLSLGGVI